MVLTRGRVHLNFVGTNFFMLLYIFLGLVSIWILINFIDALSGRPVNARRAGDFHSNDAAFERLRKMRMTSRAIREKAVSDFQKRGAERLRDFHSRPNGFAMRQMRHPQGSFGKQRI